MKQLILPALVAVFGLSLAAHAVEEPKIKAPQTEKKDVKKDEKPATAEIGKPAPDFTLTDVNGKSVKLSDYKGKIVVLGLVRTKFGALESKDELKRRIAEAAQYAPLEQLCLSPQCGFSSTVHGNDIAVEAQRAKLKLVVDVAREVWG